uniref:Sister chromatid cohesion 1 protein 2 n=5 Tax=Lygus hesperus TaxID=30085 RepID=A0A0K8T812_LYGHE
MGQCTSSKSAQIFNHQPFDESNQQENSSKKKKHKSSSPLHLPAKLFKMEKGSKANGKTSVTRGQVTRFGFKRPTPTTPPLPSVPASPADINVQETIEPLVIAPVLPKNGTPRASRAKKEGKAPNRFGFIPPANQLSNKVADLQGSQESLRAPTAIKLGGGRSLSETRYNKSVDGKVLTSSGKIPHPQYQTPLLRPSPAHYRSNDSVVCSPAVGKLAKTAANNHTLRVSNGYAAEGAASRLKRNEEVLEIRQLEQSPGAARHQPAHQKLARPMEMVFSGPKRFELRDVPQSAGARGSQEAQRAADPAGGALQGEGGTSPAANLTMNERIRREVCGLPPRYPTTSSMTSSVVSCSSVLSPDTGDEEKLTRDTKANEKTLPVAGDESPNEEDLWGGPGEAMALDDDLPNTNLADIDQSPEGMNPPLRSVLLTIEDPTFATLAALSNAGLLEDEAAPDSPDISCSSPSSVEPLPPPPPIISSKPDSPNSPVSPTHASNSSSSDTKDRDFLIDDEIADQPGLVFGSARRRVEDEPSLLDRSKTIAQLAGDVSQALHNSLHRDSHGGSAETLSPCESLASDDLMGDFDMSALDELNDLEDGPLCSEIMSQSDQVIKEWSSLLSSNPGLSTGLRKTPRHRLRSATRPNASTGDSPLSALTSPRRHPRRMETKSPAEDKSEDSGIKFRERYVTQHVPRCDQHQEHANHAPAGSSRGS